MIRHIAMFTWKPEATEEEKQRVVTEVAKLPSIVPSVRAFASGTDAGLNQGNFDFAVTADFDDEDGYVAYRDDPGHREIVQRHIAPILGRRAAVQVEF